MRALLPIAILISLATPAGAQRAADPEPAWRASALALVPAGFVAGEAYRTDEPAMTGYLAVYPADANDPKSPGSVFAPRQMLVVKLASNGGALSAELKPRNDLTRGNRDSTMTDMRRSSRNSTPSSPPNARRYRRAPSRATSAHGRRIAIQKASMCAPSLR